jgi:hypothetical protein
MIDNNYDYSSSVTEESFDESILREIESFEIVDSEEYYFI